MEWSTPSRALIVGLGRSGLAAARLASRDGAEVWVTDLRHESQLDGEMSQLPAESRQFLGGHPESCLEGVELVVCSPGVSPTAELLIAAQRRGIAVMTEVEFAWLHVQDRPLVAVTGSNGKSTVTVLAAEMLRAGGLAAAAGGNLGTAACELAMDEGWQCWVLEISSFQAELLTAMRPDVGIFLNLSQDHFERHPDMESYLSAKQRLFAFQNEDDLAVLNADDPVVTDIPTRARRLRFSLVGRADAWLDGDRLRLGDEVITERPRLSLGGIHNVANGLAAAIAVNDLGVDVEAIAGVLEAFTGLTHRHLTVHDEGGVRWVDDSKATNVGATLAALRGYPDGSVHLILGGQSKGQDFSVMAAEVSRAVARLYVIGVDGPAIAAVLGAAAPVEECGNLERAVQRARGSARPGQWVVLAPACASFDQFSGYSERGDRFTALAREEVAPCP